MSAFLVDENLPASLAEALKDAGFRAELEGSLVIVEAGRIRLRKA